MSAILPLPPAPDGAWSAPWWLPGGNLQTIWPALFSHRHVGGTPPRLRRERWSTPDGDFVDVDFVLPQRPGAVAESAPPARCRTRPGQQRAASPAFPVIAQARILGG